MNVSKEYKERNNSQLWDLLKSDYENNIKKDCTELQIPKKLHQIWIGNKLPDELKKLSESWQELCISNNWEYFFWNDENIEHLKNEIFNSTTNFGQKSDILRYNILKLYGGVYVDMDFIPIKIFDDFLLKNPFFCGIAYESTPTLYNGLIGSSKDGELITKLCDIELIKNSNAEEVMETTGPYYLTRKFFEYKKNEIAYPLTYFYPFSNRNFDRYIGDDYKNYIKNETYCVHLWKCSWM